MNEKEALSSALPVNKLNVPKRTKLFVDQTMRERENSKGAL